VQIEITCRHTPVEPSEKQYATDKISQLEHYWNRPLSAQLVIEFEKYDYRVELKLHAGHSHITVSESGRHFQVVLDKLIRVAERRLRRLKGKTAKEQKRRRRLFVSEIRESAGEESLPELIDPQDFEMEEMTRGEALERFRASGRNFFVYHDLESNSGAIVYRRKNGATGFIEL